MSKKEKEARASQSESHDSDCCGPFGRREFLKTASAAALASTVIGSRGAAAPTGSASPQPVDSSKILNYHPKMGYRPLGKTGFHISEVSLGGHGGQGIEDRVAVLERAVQAGINYVDNNIDGECDLYGAAMFKSATAKREKWFIGFASWPEKITTEYEANLTEAGMTANIEKRLKSYHTDMLDMWRPVGATWGEGQTAIPSMLMVSQKTLDLVVKVFDKVQRQGKVRCLGVSAHNPKVFRRVLTEYPQFSVIIFPYLFLTRELGGDSLLKLAHEKQMGVIGLKPFGAGTTFGLKPRQIQGRIDSRARVLVKEMLQEPRISAIIPGVNIPEQIDVNVQGSYDRDTPHTPEDKKAIQECTRNFYAHLTPDYQWLQQWEIV